MNDPSALPTKALVVCVEVGSDAAVGRAVAELIGELEKLGVQVTVARSARDAIAVLASERDLHVAVVDWDLTEDGTAGRTVVQALRAQSEDLPLFLMADREGIDAIPIAVVRRCDGFVYPLDDTADWIAGRLSDAAQRYRRELAPTMFAGLVKFAREHEYSWHTPGHEGGAAFRKSPVGRAFFEFFGEQTFRSDLSISVGELGSLLDHSGLIGQAERDAARIFGADLTLFVTNGTSTSNRVVHQASVVAGDTVLLDRNAHKSAEQATTITHAVPVYMVPTRNAYGIIGPIPPAEMTADALAAKLAASSLGASAPVLAMVTNSTYDGLLCHVPTVERLLGAQVSRLHFDEAWYGYAAFHPLYHERHAMHRGERPANGPTVFATQSTHKLLAALSQASYIHVRNGRNPVELGRLNEAFMMHASTSPLYAIIASNDVAARMMEGRRGEMLTGESIEEAVAFRKTLARTARELADDWFFTAWQPDEVPDGKGGTVAFADAPSELLASDPQVWLLREGASWHGFAALPDAYAMLDPIKVTVLTPGMGRSGELEDFGVPAALVSSYLERHAAIVVEKTQDFSILFLFSMGVTKGKWGSLLTALFDFKRDFDRNAPLREAMPALLDSDSERYGALGLRDLAREMHRTLRETGQLHLQAQAFSRLPQQTMTNADAYAHVVRGTIEPTRLADVAGRTVAVGVVPYPPGIPLLMPGESAGGADEPFIGYLRALEEFDRRFPGFEHDLHGVEHVAGDYVIDCVKDGAA
jgi:arginine decarboxylase